MILIRFSPPLSHSPRLPCLFNSASGDRPARNGTPTSTPTITE